MSLLNTVEHACRVLGFYDDLIKSCSLSPLFPFPSSFKSLSLIVFSLMPLMPMPLV